MAREDPVKEEPGIVRDEIQPFEELFKESN